MFGRSCLSTAVRANWESPALETREAVMTAVSQFVGDAPQSDDMALMVVKRLPD